MRESLNREVSLIQLDSFTPEGSAYKVPALGMACGVSAKMKRYHSPAGFLHLQK